jgi:hypothetical protein
MTMKPRTGPFPSHRNFLPAELLWSLLIESSHVNLQKYFMAFGTPLENSLSAIWYSCVISSGFPCFTTISFARLSTPLSNGFSSVKMSTISSHVLSPELASSWHGSLNFSEPAVCRFRRRSFCLRI